MAKEENKDKPKHLSPGEVRYLALEGGGGKGVTYLGAVKKLEEYKILPVQRKPFYLGNDEIKLLNLSSNQIRGISGSSAGAITALMLALGMNSAGIEYALREKAKKFEDFCDGPSPGIHRIFLNGEYQLTNKIENGAFRERLEEKINNANEITFTRLLGILAVNALPQALSYFTTKINEYPLRKILKSDASPHNFMKALIMDGGLFLGKKATDFFDDLISTELRKFVQTNVSIPRYVSFENFKKFTDVDLRITGTNTYTNRPMYFSHLHTPTFPVALAVSISMNIPILFKPIIIDSMLRNAKGIAQESYKGLWVDGGLLNNLPLHAFDDLSTKRVDPKEKGLFPFNENIVALRLMDGRPGYNKAMNFNWTKWINETSLLAQSGMLFSTLLYPSEEGQIRTPLEESRTIPLYTYGLSMLNFAPSPSESEEPIKEAFAAVKKYFEPEKK